MICCVLQVEQISKEQNYQRYREERFRLTSESTNQRVLWYVQLTFYQPHFSHALVWGIPGVFCYMFFLLLTAKLSRWFSRSLFRFHNYFGVPGSVADPGWEKFWSEKIKNNFLAQKYFNSLMRIQIRHGIIRNQDPEINIPVPQHWSRASGPTLITYHNVIWKLFHWNPSRKTL